MKKKTASKKAVKKKVKTLETMPPTHAPGFKPLLRKPKPSFQPLVELWGLRGNKMSQTDWELARIHFGRYLHPKLNGWITFVQSAYDTGRFPYSSHTHSCCKANPVTYLHDSVLEDTRQDAASARQKAGKSKQHQPELSWKIGMPVPGGFGIGGSVSARVNKLRLAEWNDEKRAVLEQCRRLGQAMLAAIASRDVEFFKHIIEILTAMGYSQIVREPKPVIPAKLAVSLAIKALRSDDEIFQLEKKLGTLPENISRTSLQFIANVDHDIKSTKQFDIVEVREKLDTLCHDPEFVKLLPENWGENLETCEKQIGRYARGLGETLKRSNEKKLRINKRI